MLTEHMSGYVVVANTNIYSTYRQNCDKHRWRLVHQRIAHTQKHPSLSALGSQCLCLRSD